MSTPQIWIRKAQEDDLPAILSLLAVMHDELPGASDEMMPIFQACLNQERRTILLGGVDAQPVGTADLLVVPNLSRQGRSWAVVENVVVRPTYRRLGIARALMTEVERRALEAGCYKIQLISNERRSEAHRLYESMGYDAPVRGYRKYLAGHD